MSVLGTNPLLSPFQVSPQSSHPDGPDPPEAPPKLNDTLVGLLFPPCGVPFQLAEELASLLPGGPWGWENVHRSHPTWDAPVFPGAIREPQDAAIHPHSASHAHLLLAFLTPLSKLPVSMACHYCVCRVETPPSLNQRERCGNLLLCSPFSEKHRTNLFQ